MTRQTCTPAPLTGGELMRRSAEQGARRILDATADLADDDPDDKES